MITKILWRIYSNFLYVHLSKHAFNTELLPISMDYSIQNKGTESLKVRLPLKIQNMWPLLYL